MTPGAVPDDHDVVDDDPTPAPLASPTPADPRRVRLSSRVLSGTLDLLLGEGAIKPSGGGATYDTVVVPDDKAIVSFSGVEPWALSIPVMLDSWVLPHQDLSVRQAISQIIELTQPEPKKPPKVRVNSLAIPSKLNGMLWRVTGIEWGDPLFEMDGSHERQPLTLSLLEANDGDLFDVKRRKRKKGKKGKGRGGKGGHGAKHYTIKKGDTLQKIAAKFYGDADKWHRIAKANNIKNPRRLNAGRKIKIP